MNNLELANELSKLDKELGIFRGTHGKRWPNYAHSHFAEIRDRLMKATIKVHRGEITKHDQPAKADALAKTTCNSNDFNSAVQ